jgi:hypothetical protein
MEEGMREKEGIKGIIEEEGIKEKDEGRGRDEE